MSLFQLAPSAHKFSVVDNFRLVTDNKEPPTLVTDYELVNIVAQLRRETQKVRHDYVGKRICCSVRYECVPRSRMIVFNGPSFKSVEAHVEGGKPL